jgi:hypothetical protein
MKRPEAVLRHALVNNATFSGLAGARVYPLVAPADAVYPFVTWRRVAVQRLQSLSVPAGTPRTTIDYTIFGATYDQARQVSDAMRDVLDGYAGTVDTTVVHRANVENETDDFVTLTGAELPPSYAITMTVETWWDEP